ncbi:MAG: ATP-binding cassette domain-containing protein [Clostridia bacterium]|nr:ATP-binding cassette domain-containing protein [Clostridia bacterium]
MEKLLVDNLSFRYALGDREVLKNASFSMEKGGMAVVCGASGSGKTTLLKLLCPAIAPKGERTGSVTVDGRDIYAIPAHEAASMVAYVAQNPEAQIVTDTAYGELAFGPENLGIKPEEIRRRIAWTASYFGIEEWLDKKTQELSGGQKQILNLASAIMMKPEIILLDEPTTYLDPVMTSRFISMLQSVNRELGTTVIVAEHRPELFAGKADRYLTVEDGEVRESAEEIVPPEPDMFYERLFAVNEPERRTGKTDRALKCTDVRFRFRGGDRDVLKGLNVDIPKSSVYALLGSNGAGKTTFLKCVTGELKPYRGKIELTGKAAALPQNPISMFIEETPRKDFRNYLVLTGCPIKDISSRIEAVAEKTGTAALLDRNFLDLSGGETEMCAVAKLMLTGAEIMLLDEPTKGLDTVSKKRLAEFFDDLSKQGMTVIFVTHDAEFAREAATGAGVLSGGVVLE